MSLLQFRFLSNYEEGEPILGQGFRFGSCLLCATPAFRDALAAPKLQLTEFSTGTTRFMNIHTRLIALEEEEDVETALIGLLLHDDEEVFQDYSSRSYTMSANVGDIVYIQNADGITTTGQIVARERIPGNFRYLITLHPGRNLIGCPVFIGDVLLGVLVRSNPFGGTVIGLEKLTSHSGPSSRAEVTRRRSYVEAYRSLLPDSHHDALRDRVSRMNLFINNQDWQVT